jgi:hypothetical protein
VCRIARTRQIRAPSCAGAEDQPVDLDCSRFWPGDQFRAAVLVRSILHPRRNRSCTADVATPRLLQLAAWLIIRTRATLKSLLQYTYNNPQSVYGRGKLRSADNSLLFHHISLYPQIMQNFTHVILFSRINDINYYLSMHDSKLSPLASTICLLLLCPCLST